MPRTVLIFSVFVLLLGAGLTAAATATAATSDPVASSYRQRVVHEGIAVGLSIDPLETGRKPGELRAGDPVQVRLEMTDSHTGSPLPGLFPAGWMDLMPVGRSDSETCKNKVEAFLGGGLLAKPELDLNSYYVLTLNQDATISVVDPLFGFGGSKLLTLVLLSSPGEDWALTRDQQLFVSLPRSNRVAVVETSTWKVVREIEVGAVPTRLALQGDQRRLWVAFEGSAETPSGVSVIDTGELREIARIPTGRGRHEIALGGGDAYAFITNATAGTLSVVDTRTLLKVKDVPTGPRPTSLAYSSLGQAVFVSDRQDGGITVVDAARHEVRARLQAAPGVGQIRFAPGGRLGFAVNTAKNEVYILDAAKGRIVQTGDTEPGPDQVTFSDAMAYLRHQKSDIVLMIPLDGVGEEGKPVPVVDFPGGQNPPGKTDMPSAADSIVPAAGARAMLVANPLDKAIYYYKEGMAAPMGHFQNYGRQPRAVTVVDRSLREVRPGVYETRVRLGRPGAYELALFVGTPRVVQCFPLQVNANPDLERARDPRTVDVALLLESGESEAGKPFTVRVHITGRGTKEPRNDLKDVTVMAMLSPGIWHRRYPAVATGSGFYEVTVEPPQPGLYYLFVEVASAGLPLKSSPSELLQVKAPAANAP